MGDSCPRSGWVFPPLLKSLTDTPRSCFMITVDSTSSSQADGLGRRDGSVSQYRRNVSTLATYPHCLFLWVSLSLAKLLLKLTITFFPENLKIFILCVFTCLNVYASFLYFVPRNPEEGVGGSHGTGVRNSCKMPCGWWEPVQGPRRE